jgi:hypothetical protein
VCRGNQEGSELASLLVFSTYHVTSILRIRYFWKSLTRSRSSRFRVAINFIITSVLSMLSPGVDKMYHVVKEFIIIFGAVEREPLHSGKESRCDFECVAICHRRVDFFGSGDLAR